MKKILVTGASGFIGSKLVERLVSSGHNVKTFGRSYPRFLEKLSIEHCQGDINDLNSVTQALRDCSIVFHLAGLVSYRKSDYNSLYKTNVLGTHNIMSACLQNNIERVIHVSSIAGMGIPQPGSIGTEEIQYNLKGHGLYYCDTKYEGEQEAIRFSKQGLPVVILNPGIVLGKGDTHPHHHAIFRSLAKGWFLGYPTGGVMFSDIQDLLPVCLNSITMGQPGERYVVGSTNLSYKEAGEKIVSILGKKKLYYPIPGWLAERAGHAFETICPILGKKSPFTRQVGWLSQHKLFFSSDKATNELGLKQTPFEETLSRTISYYLPPNKLKIGAI